MKLRIGFIIVLALLGAIGYVAYTQYAAGLYYLAGQYDRMMNPYGVDPDAPEPTAGDRLFHRSMFIADLHIDTLKWERDPLQRSMFGHADLPRLNDGNIALQVFTIVTKSPLSLPWSRCVSGRMPDTNTPLNFMQGRPVFSLKDRALYQIERLKDAVERSRDSDGPELRLIENMEDLERLVDDRLAGKSVIGGILGIEGGHWIGGDEATNEDVRREMQELFDAGVRMFAPTHRFDNALSGSNDGCTRYGLTDPGRVALTEAERLGILVDLAHISSDGLRDSVELLSSPVTVSHIGIRAECEAPCRPDRNLSDEDIALIVQNGGVIGVGYWPQAIGPSVWRIADVMEHIMLIAEQEGAEHPSHHAALGSDYDGSVTPMIEVGHLDVLTAITRRRDNAFHPDVTRDIFGRNVCRLFGTVLPGGDVDAASELCARLEHATPPPTEAAQ
ncbi:MAG: membrane dipeptidase [Ectothiorhodospiraceae bacterium]|nr:membrane dipeptidase [Ectothiorhodospiraceae bacterium]